MFRHYFREAFGRVVDGVQVTGSSGLERAVLLDGVRHNGVRIAGEKKTTNLVYGPSSNAISLLETRLRWSESRNLIREYL
jgi:hypothetical protein